MQYFKAVLKLVSPLGTPLAADTLFGHLCWSIVYRHSEAALKEFLDEMGNEQPPIIFSDPFPKGMLPVPVLPWVLPKDFEPDKVKNARKVTLFSESAFDKVRNCLSSTNLIQAIITELNDRNENNSENKKDVVAKLSPHNRIDRIAGGTISGGIFFTEDHFVDTNIGVEYDLYIGSSYEITKIESLLKQTLEGGYGRDKGTGLGQIEFIGMEQIVFPPLPNVANAGMLLSPCTPAKNDPVEGYWKIKAKAGKLGGHWAITENPFKKTIMMLQAGSIFKTEKPKPFYGRLISDAHSQLPVRHYGLSLVLPVHLENEVAA